MAFKVNYNQQRNERDRAKQAKKEAKLREREAEVMRRRSGAPDGEAEPSDTDASLAIEPGAAEPGAAEPGAAEPNPNGGKADGTP